MPTYAKSEFRVNLGLNRKEQAYIRSEQAKARYPITAAAIIHALLAQAINEQEKRDGKR